MAKPSSSDIQVSFSFAKTSSHLISFSLKLPSISHPWTCSPLTLIFSTLFPQKHFYPNKCHLKILALTIPSYSDTLLLPPFCPQLPSFSSCTQLNPSFCLGSPWREKACVLKDVLKILPDTYSTYSEGEERNPKITTNVSPIQTKSSSSLVICWWRNMMYLHLHITLKNSRQHFPNVWCNPVRECSKFCEGAWMNFWDMQLYSQLST